MAPASHRSIRSFSPTADAPPTSAQAEPKPMPGKAAPSKLSAKNDLMGRMVGLALCGSLVYANLRFEPLSDPIVQPLLLFFIGLAILSVLQPASGPCGRRVGLLPGVGLAALLFLPPLVALLPLILANTAYAFSRDMPTTQRAIWQRGAFLILATLGSGYAAPWMLSRFSMLSPMAALSLRLALLSSLYVVLYAGARYLCLRFPVTATRQVRKRARAAWRLEAASLLAAMPVAILMTTLHSHLGIPGVAAAAGLVALLLMVAHFGFEVVLLREQVRAMEKISAVTLADTSPNRIIERFLSLSSGLITCDRAALWLVDASSTRLERVAHLPALPTVGGSSVGGPPPMVRSGEGLVGRVADRKAALIVRDAARDPRVSSAERLDRLTGSYSLLLLPLVVGGETVGVAQYEREAPGCHTQRELNRIRALALQAAATLANVRMHQDVYAQAVTDGLTGLYNRRHMQTRLQDERRRAHRYGHGLSVIMLDVDGFKNYNDTYGHVQGDVLLVKLAALLRQNVRGVDIVGRYGGEEFIIVMPETPADEAWQTAERLRQAVASTVFPGFAEDPELAVFKTISLGTATFPEDTSDTHALVSLADKALYQAKRAGRNQTIQAGAMTSNLDAEALRPGL